MSQQTRRGKTGSGGGHGYGNSFWWFALILFVLAVGTWIWWSSSHSENEPKPQRVAVRLSNPPPVLITNAVAKAAPVPKPILPGVLTPLPILVKTSAPDLTPVLPRGVYPRPVSDILEAQVALSQFAISAGSIDGAIGSQTHAALSAFQSKVGLPATGELDAATRAQLTLPAAPLTNYMVTSNDLARLQPVSKSWLEKSQQTALDFETILELLAERGHASPNMIRRLNPTLNWSNVVAGTEVSIPAADYPKAPAKAALITISLAKRQLEVFDAQTNLLAHFPCSIAARFEKRPVGELHVTAIAPNPDYTFNPEVFSESEEARNLSGKLILPPGPNNPVGTAWVSLDRPGYGMHGTPNPEQVGRTESHGCFRLANWNADYLIKLVAVGTLVRVTP